MTRDELDRDYLRRLEADPELAKLMDSAARGAHESRRLQWQAEADECINRERSFDDDDDPCGACEHLKAVRNLGHQLDAADNTYRQQFHRAETLKVKVWNWQFATFWLLLVVLGLVAKVMGKI